MEEETVPTVGVTARPLSSDMFTWHANIRGPEGTAYAGGIFHMEIKFTELYPLAPPTVTLFTAIQHPNIFGNTLCLDMFSTTQKTLY
jgi:ubiquitin-protein ligase